MTGTTVVLVCGGRDFTDARLADASLDALHARLGISLVVHGNARGADTLAHNWALRHNIAVRPFTAQWARYGRSAGTMRNEQMLREARPDYVVAFPGGVGTAHMVRIARANGTRVIVVAAEQNCAPNVTDAPNVAPTGPRAQDSRS